MQAEIEDRKGEVFIKLNVEILNNKSNMLNMACMLMIVDDPEILVCAQVALHEANEAVNKSCFRIISLRKKLEFLPTGSGTRSITGG
jgi:hypothetical protein